MRSHPTALFGGVFTEHRRSRLPFFMQLDSETLTSHAFEGISAQQESRFNSGFVFVDIQVMMQQACRSEGGNSVKEGGRARGPHEGTEEVPAKGSEAG